MVERPLAQNALLTWRLAILQEHSVYEARVKDIQKKYKYAEAIRQKTQPLTALEGWGITRRATTK